MNRVFQNLKVRIFNLSSKNSKYSKDFVHFALGFFLTSFIALFTSIYVNENLDQENLGKLTYYKSLLELLSYIFSLLLYRSYLRFNAKGLSLNTIRMVKIFTLFAIFALIISSYLLTKSYFVILFAFFILYEERLYFFRSIMATNRLNILRIGAALLTFLSIFVVNKYFDLNVYFVLMSYGVGFLISLTLLGNGTSRVSENEEVNLKKILLFSLPALGSVIIKISQDFGAQFFIKEFFDFNEVSTFSIALRVLLSVKLFSSLLMMYYPSIYFREIDKKNIKFLNKVRILMSLFMGAVSLIAIIFVDQLYHLMGASEYLEYVLYFRILVIAELLFIVGGFYGTYLAHILKTHILMIVFGVGVLVNFTLLIIFLKSHGVIVAAYAILCANLFTFLFHMFYTRRLELKFLLS